MGHRRLKFLPNYFAVAEAGLTFDQYAVMAMPGNRDRSFAMMIPVMAVHRTLYHHGAVITVMMPIGLRGSNRKQRAHGDGAQHEFLQKHIT